MWTDHYLTAKKCLAMFEAAMNAREWDVAQIQAANLRRLGAMLIADAGQERENATQQG